MRARLLVLLGVATVLGLACAQGSSLTGGDDGDGGTGATTGTSTTGNTTAATTGGGGSGAGGTCTESPCKLTLPQCGCPTGEQCSVGATGRECIPEGSNTQGTACGGADGECAAGLVCIGVSATVAMCGKVCTSDAQCSAPGGLCIITLVDGNQNPIPDVTLCTENCDPITNAGCSGAPGASCQLGEDNQMRLLTYCTGSGTGTQGATCTTSDQCAPTYGCFSTDGGVTSDCLKYCNFNAPNCPGGGTCLEFDPPLTLGGTEYGACL